MTHKNVNIDVSTYTLWISPNFPSFLWNYSNHLFVTIKIERDKPLKYIFSFQENVENFPDFLLQPNKTPHFHNNNKYSPKFYFLHSSKFLIQFEISWTIQVEVLIHRSNNKVKKFVFWFFKIASEGWIWFKTSNSCQI